ncbi:MAG: hypothetical protein RBS08_05335 [Bdellovibrionales bacterium]|jgi:hypothetical protein|nr:hypothetical protein [Bdellovibrionales bacterium]
MSIDNKHLNSIRYSKKINPAQGNLPLAVQKQGEFEGIVMGILEDGTPYLTQRGLAHLCGVENAHIGTLDTQWDDDKPRIKKIREHLLSHGKIPSQPSIKVKQGPRIVNAYPDTVCIAAIEYYAFDAGANVQEKAKSTYRSLATKSLREMIYEKLGYTSTDQQETSLRYLTDRLIINADAVEDGYFCVLKETASLVVKMIKAGIKVDHHLVADISVGISWGRYWTDSNMEMMYGARKRFYHTYSEADPQSMSNPQEAWSYPEEALGAFHKWMRESYLRGGKYEKYLKGKVGKKAITSAIATAAISAMNRDNL